MPFHFPRHLVRRVGFGVLALAALLVFFLDAPSGADTSGHAGQVAAIEADDDANNASTQGAPQQQVVNGWTTNQYLRLLSEQVNDQLDRPVSDPRPAALIVILILAACLHWSTTGVERAVEAGSETPLVPFAASADRDSPPSTMSEG